MIVTPLTDRRGFIANIGNVRTRSNNTYDAKVATLAIALSLIAGFLSFEIASTTLEAPPETVEGIQYYNVTKSQSIANTWGVATHQMFARNIAIVDHEAHLVAAKYNKGMVTFLEGKLLAFNYTNMSPPASFKEARLEMKLDWLAMNGDAGPKTLPFYIERNFTVNLYEVKGVWKSWTGNTTQKDGVSWAQVGSGALVVDRNPVASLSNVNMTTHGQGKNTYGNLTFNIAKAINDWKAGTWKPQWGFLVTILAPWETTSYPWFNMGSLDYLGFVMHVEPAQMQIGIDVVIPEFAEVMIPVTGMLVIALVVGRLRKKGLKGRGKD